MTALKSYLQQYNQFDDYISDGVGPADVIKSSC